MGSTWGCWESWWRWLPSRISPSVNDPVIQRGPRGSEACQCDVGTAVALFLNLGGKKKKKNNPASRNPVLTKEENEGKEQSVRKWVTWWSATIWEIWGEVWLRTWKLCCDRCIYPWAHITILCLVQHGCGRCLYCLSLFSCCCTGNNWGIPSCSKQHTETFLEGKF